MNKQLEVNTTNNQYTIIFRRVDNPNTYFSNNKYICYLEIKDTIGNIIISLMGTEYDFIDILNYCISDDIFESVFRYRLLDATNQNTYFNFDIQVTDNNIFDYPSELDPIVSLYFYQVDYRGEILRLKIDIDFMNYLDIFEETLYCLLCDIENFKQYAYFELDEGEYL